MIIPNSPSTNGDQNLDSLINEGKLWVTNFSKKLKSSGLNISEEEENKLSSAVETMTLLYGPKKRNYESIRACKHPLKINDLLLGLYNNKLKDKSIESPDRFINCFSCNYIEMIHTVIFHDILELKLIKSDKLSKLYHDEMKMDGDKIISNIRVLTVHKNDNDNTIRQNMDELQNHDIPLYAKIGDITLNSESCKSKSQIYNMINFYLSLVKGNFRPLYDYCKKNITQNKEYIMYVIKKDKSLKVFSNLLQ